VIWDLLKLLFFLIFGIWVTRHIVRINRGDWPPGFASRVARVTQQSDMRLMLKRQRQLRRKRARAERDERK